MATDKFSFVFLSSLSLLFPFAFWLRLVGLRRFYYLDFDLFQLLIISDTKEYLKEGERARADTGCWTVGELGQSISRK